MNCMEKETSEVVELVKEIKNIKIIKNLKYLLKDYIDGEEKAISN